MAMAMATVVFARVDRAAAKQRRLQRTVRLTARASAVLFGTAAWTAAAGPTATRQAKWLYAGFAVAHAAHFAAVARYAHVTGGRNLFPGGRSLHSVGGWPTIIGIYGAFGALVIAGRATLAPPEAARPQSAKAGRGAIGLIGAMFVSTYLRQIPSSRWFAAPATVIGLGVTASLVADASRRP
jgi:hypothetical protein